MELAGKKLGLIVAAPAGSPNFSHALGLAREALGRGLTVYLYLIDDGVAGLNSPGLSELEARGLKLFACAYSLQKRKLSMETTATLSGLTILSDIIGSSDRFLAFR